MLFAGLTVPASGFADGNHPITLEITCDPMPELEGEGTIPDLHFTIRNESQSDYTLTDGKLSGGFEDREMILDESITVLAGSTREFDMYDVPVSDEQLGRDVTYTLSWEETETIIDPETGDATFITHTREAEATMRIERFVIPELTVSASSKDGRVRAGEKFTVDYLIKNDTEFDMTGLKLYDPEQSMQTIALPSDEISAGKSVKVSVEYEMGEQDMTFSPCVEYVARRREMLTHAEKTLTVESVVVDLQIVTEAFPPTEQGTTFSVTIKNNGNRTVTDIQLYDEINTPIEKPFMLSPDQSAVILYDVAPAVSSDQNRVVRFHLTAVDCFDEPIRVTDEHSFEVVPYIASDAVRLGLYVVLQSPYYDDNGKLCASIQFEIRNNGDLRLHNAVLREETMFGVVTSYDVLLQGDTFFTKTYQLDGVNELRFRLDALDPAGNTCSSETIRLDLSDLKDRIEKKTDPVYVYTTNPYLQDLDAKYSGILKTIVIIALAVAGVLAVVCIILLAVELRLRSKLPAEFEEDMEKAMRSTKRRMENQLFSDAPTEQFGYTAPIKLRNYGELTEAEAKARREQYANGLKESLEKDGVQPSERPAASRIPVRVDSDGTRVLPTAKPGENAAVERPAAARPVDPGTTAFRRPAKAATGAFKRPIAENSTESETTAFRRPAETATGAFKRPAAETPVDPAATAFRRPAEAGTGAFKRTAAEKPVEPDHSAAERNLNDAARAASPAETGKLRRSADLSERQKQHEEGMRAFTRSSVHDPFAPNPNAAEAVHATAVPAASAPVIVSKIAEPASQTKESADPVAIRRPSFLTDVPPAPKPEPDLSPNLAPENSLENAVPDDAVTPEPDLSPEPAPENPLENAVPNDAVTPEPDLSPNPAPENPLENAFPDDAVTPEPDLSPNPAPENPLENDVPDDAVTPEPDLSPNPAPENPLENAVPDDAVTPEPDLSPNPAPENPLEAAVPDNPIGHADPPVPEPCSERQGPRRLEEKPVPRRRKAAYQTVKRMNG